MKLGIIGAMESEVETLVKQLKHAKQINYAAATYYEGELEGIEAVVVRCGIGKVNAALCVQTLYDIFHVSHVVNTGIAGSLNAQLDIGDFVISEDAMYHDVDCCNFGYQAGQMPGMPVSFTADAILRDVAVRAAEAVCPGHSRVGRVASGDQFVCSKELKNKIIDITGALCTEMEGAAIAHASYRNKIPFVIIRAISDKADDSAEMDYPTFEALAAERCAAVVLAFSAMLN